MTHLMILLGTIQKVDTNLRNEVKKRTTLHTEPRILESLAGCRTMVIFAGFL